MFFSDTTLWTVLCLFGSQVFGSELVGDFVVLCLIGILFILMMNTVESDKMLKTFCTPLNLLQSTSKALEKLVYAQNVENNAQFDSKN